MPLGSVEHFVIGSQDWDSYVRRVKQFIALNKIDPTLHVATLVTLVGSDCYALMCDLCAPDMPEDKTFDKLVTLVKEHLEPERSEIAERHLFRQRKQLQGEGIRTYLQSLKHLAKTCNFTGDAGTLEVNLRDQFVSGLCSEEMRSRLFAERDVSYKRAVELALALEAAERHAAVACAPAAAAPGAGALAAPPDDGLHRVGAARGRPPSQPAQQPARRRPCGRCGKESHSEYRCRYKYFTCDVCHEKGHLKVMCKRNKSENSESGKKLPKGQFFFNDSDSENEDCHFYNIVCSDGDGPYYAQVMVNDIKCKFEIDTGSKISAVSKKYYDEYLSHLPLQNKLLILKSYTGDVIETLGFIEVEVKFGAQSAHLELFVIEKGGPPLMGRTWIKKLKLNLVDCYNMTDNDSMAQTLKNEFPEVFADGLGTFKSKIRLCLNDDTPVFVKARPLPLALRGRVQAELERLQREGVIYKVDRSDYGTPIVPVVKSNGGIRICGDYKITLNPLLKDYHYPLPRIEEIFAALGGGEQYSKLDLSNAFQQCILEDESQPLTAVTTHCGTFVYKRVPFGLKCIPENFQKIMEETLSGLPSTAVFADDIAVTGKDKATHMANLRAVLQRLKDNGLRINFKKCNFFQNSVTYLGYRIDKFGLHTDPNKIQAIVAAPVPTNVTQLKSFMGLVNFYSKFCVNMSDILKPLYNLLKKNSTWKWSDECNFAFNKIKKVLSSAPALAHYSPELPLVLAVDSSPYGLGAVLLQREPDGTERAVSCASRTLNDAESNYSQLDKEALAIVYGVTKHHHYLYGRHFTLRSDHQALSYIFGKNKGIPVTAASRLQRYAVKLAAYDFNVEFVRSAQNCYADALSRLPLETNKKVHGSNDSKECSYLHFVEESFPVSFREIKAEVQKDRVLSKIYGYVMFGWPARVLNEEELPFFRRKDNLHIEHGCLVWGYRLVIPVSLRKDILMELHAGHPGIVKMKQIARNYVWWDGIDGDIEQAARSCGACETQRAQPPPAPLHVWPWPEEPWSRLNVDFLGPFNHKYYFVVVDAHSKWIEVEKVPNTSAVAVEHCLRQIFARFGLPKRIISDNGPPFSSAEFGMYLKRNGISHTLIPPYHPASNGAAENAVRTVKRVLKKALVEQEDDMKALSRFLFTYRNSEHSKTQREPAVALLGRRLRGRLDLLRPDTAQLVASAQHAAQQRAPAAAAARGHAPGDPVLMRDYSKWGSKWAEGKIVEKSGPVTYSVKDNNGHVHKRHIDQLLNDKKKQSRYSFTDLKPDDTQNIADSYTREELGKPGDNGDGGESWEDADTLLEGEAGLAAGGGGSVQECVRPRRDAATRCLEKIKEHRV
ncbi:hypothetical protein JYU34_022067 [Plutella xylostella]|uniref:RNA-directed DNA polymerase n=1 Tax=Plutella xylostella TaxID=51655 RepID=A0ABQ7PQ41_PLUXY|nr:hypothetical protein JYU34_022067 [Plutella xylostella]